MEEFRDLADKFVEAFNLNPAWVHQHYLGLTDRFYNTDRQGDLKNLNKLLAALNTWFYQGPELKPLDKEHFSFQTPEAWEKMVDYLNGTLPESGEKFSDDEKTLLAHFLTQFQDKRRAGYNPEITPRNENSNAVHAVSLYLQFLHFKSLLPEDNQRALEPHQKDILMLFLFHDGVDEFINEAFSASHSYAKNGNNKVRPVGTELHRDIFLGHLKKLAAEKDISCPESLLLRADELLKALDVWKKINDETKNIAKALDVKKATIEKILKAAHLPEDLTKVSYEDLVLALVVKGVDRLSNNREHLAYQELSESLFPTAKLPPVLQVALLEALRPYVDPKSRHYLESSIQAIRALQNGRPDPDYRNPKALILAFPENSPLKDDYVTQVLSAGVCNTWLSAFAYAKWVGNFCEVLHSNQLSPEKRSAVTQAIHALFETDKNTRISGDFLMENISRKYGSGQDTIDAFQGALSDAMGENYPPVLSQIQFDDATKEAFTELFEKMADLNKIVTNRKKEVHNTLDHLPRSLPTRMKQLFDALNVAGICGQVGFGLTNVLQASGAIHLPEMAQHIAASGQWWATIPTMIPMLRYAFEQRSFLGAAAVGANAVCLAQMAAHPEQIGVWLNGMLIANSLWSISRNKHTVDPNDRLQPADVGNLPPAINHEIVSTKDFLLKALSEVIQNGGTVFQNAVDMVKGRKPDADWSTKLENLKAFHSLNAVAHGVAILGYLSNNLVLRGVAESVLGVLVVMDGTRENIPAWQASGLIQLGAKVWLAVDPDNPVAVGALIASCGLFGLGLMELGQKKDPSR